MNNQPEQIYAITWKNDPRVSQVRRGQTEIFPLRWFDDDGGFDREDQQLLKNMNVGDTIWLGDDGDYNQVVIRRMPDDTVPTGKW